MRPATAALASLALLLGTGGASAQGKAELAAEQRIVDYLKQNVKPGQQLRVSDLAGVFKSEDERRVINRLFNTFFKIPLFVAQYKATTNEAPRLADIAERFNLPIEGEASVLLSIIENDPRVPKFIRRDPSSGEIASVDVEAIRKHPRFGQEIERTLVGWEGKEAPPFALELFDGKALSSAELAGRSYLVYFWFSGCPPCMKISPHMAELQKQFSGRRFTVIAVNADRFLELEVTDADRAAYVRKVGFTFPVGHLTKKMQQDFGNVNVFPTLFLVSDRGVIRKHYVNYQTLEALRSDVESLLGRDTAPGR